MKRPSRKRAPKVPPPWQGASPVDPNPGKDTASGTPGEKKRRFAPTKKEKVLTPQEEGALAAAAERETTPDTTSAADEGAKAPAQPGRFAPVAKIARGPIDKLKGLSAAPRIIVIGLLAIVVVFAALQLRDGRDDGKLVREALERYEQASADKDYQTLCDELLASSYVKQTASSGLPCEVALRTALEDVRNPTLTVLGVEVNGDRAAARVRGTAAGQVPGDAVYTLVREGDSWRILPPRPSSSNAAP